MRGRVDVACWDRLVSGADPPARSERECNPFFVLQERRGRGLRRICDFNEYLSVLNAGLIRSQGKTRASSRASSALWTQCSTRRPHRSGSCCGSVSAAVLTNKLFTFNSQLPNSDISYLIARGLTLEEIERDWKWLQTHMLDKLGARRSQLLFLAPHSMSFRQWKSRRRPTCAASCLARCALFCCVRGSHAV